MNFLTDVQILYTPISSKVILYIFVVVAVGALLLFLFNLIFNKGNTNKKKNQTLSSDELAKKQSFEAQKNDVENEISLVLKIEKSKEEVKDESRELQDS